LTFPFSRPLVDALKADIPSSLRTYDPASKTWTIAAGCADYAVALLLAYYPNAEIPVQWKRTPPTVTAPRAGAEHFQTLHLLPTAPVELIEASYRVLAHLHHPDVGGDLRSMQDLNAAYAAISGRVGS
jgi:hypothetical protein